MTSLPASTQHLKKVCTFYEPYHTGIFGKIIVNGIPKVGVPATMPSTANSSYRKALFTMVYGWRMSICQVSNTIRIFLGFIRILKFMIRIYFESTY